ncbi:mevalonate kinase [Pseudomonas sp. BJa5]|uniref:mevalonate kinase family protein n=1 Tax=Pseudomonas sp. BJa5 TaxID=2936270 RepID=UPI002559CAA0|nr:hypothetical protein [Pseudomonas sp. BGr12]MDL2419511.1 hypothetical protein [Pseudomonas sp. BGr12]
MSEGSISAVAPGKIILMGEHAVAHHSPAVVATLGLYCKVQVLPKSSQLIELCLPDLGMHRCYSRQAVLDYALQARQAWQAYRCHPDAHRFRALRGQAGDHLAKCAVGETLLHLGHGFNQGLKISVHSQIPIGAGMGSSAALAVCIPAAIISHFTRRAEVAQVQHLARQIEQRQHGLPSGVDHRTIVQGGVASFMPAAGDDLQLCPLRDAGAVLNELRLYNTGTANESTGAVVTAVRNTLQDAHSPLLQSMRQTTQAFIALLRSPHCDRARLYALIRDYERALEALGVVPGPVQALIREIEKSGGAAKVSGAGALSGSSAGLLLVLPPVTAAPLLQGLDAIEAPLAVEGLWVQRP